MTVPFYKYQGTGNDFILIDNRSLHLQLDTATVARLCHRRFGIGADGLMLLEDAPGYDFSMVYFNSDGRESSMCGNGGRCITAFAQHLGIIKDSAFFSAADGAHSARFTAHGIVALEMNDVQKIDHYDGYSILNTGSPHYVLWSESARNMEVVALGRAIRNQPDFMPAGINVNFATVHSDGSIYVRTYERGVEDETFSCGTGVTACAIAATGQQTGSFHTPVTTPGGVLAVSFTKNGPSSATDVVLTGPAAFVFEGHVKIEAGAR
jgi:diaminopimelate epimerase